MPMMVACEKGHTNMAKLLLQNGGAKSLYKCNEVRLFLGSHNQCDDVLAPCIAQMELLAYCLQCRQLGDGEATL